MADNADISALDKAVETHDVITNTTASILAAERLRTGELDSTQISDPLVAHKLIHFENEQLEAQNADIHTKLKFTISHNKLLGSFREQKTDALPTLAKATQIHNDIQDTVAKRMAELRIQSGDVSSKSLPGDPGLRQKVFEQEEIQLQDAPAHQKIQHTVGRIKIERNNL